MNEQSEQIASVLTRLDAVIGELKELKVIRSENLLPDFGEWFVKEVMKGRLATKNQKGWDVHKPNKRILVELSQHNPDAFEACDRIQVKTLTSKPDMRTLSGWCNKKYQSDDQFQMLAIVILDKKSQYRVRNLIIFERKNLKSLLAQGAQWNHTDPALKLNNIGKIKLSHVATLQPHLKPLLSLN